MTDELADGVQPEEVEGQGAEGTSDSPYADYLNRIPEEVRGDVEPVFKDWDANVTKRFQEASEQRKSWEPYEQIGVNQYDPQFVEQAIGLAQLAQQDPQGFQQWFHSYAQQYGLEAAQQAVAQQQEPVDDLYTDPSQQLEQMLAQRLTPYEQQLQQITQRLQAQDYQQAQAQAEAYVEHQLKELEQKHGDEFDRELVEHFVSNFLDRPQEAVQLAFEQSKKFRNQIEKQVLQSKVDAPGPATSGGIPDTSPDSITTFKQAGEIALATLRNNRGA